MLSATDLKDSEAEVLEMNQQLNRLQVELESNPSTVETERAFLNRRVGLRNDFIAALEDIQPPASLDEFHDVAFGVVEDDTIGKNGGDDGLKGSRAVCVLCESRDTCDGVLPVFIERRHRNSRLSRVFDEIPDNEEVSGEIHLLNHGNLTRQP